MSGTPDLFGHLPEIPAPWGWPEWFTEGKNTPRWYIANVRRGRHPIGLALTTVPGALCGNCAAWRLVNWQGGRYPKCWLMIERGTATHGRGTDIRARWKGCQDWRVAPPEQSVPRRRPDPADVDSSPAEAGGTIRRDDHPEPMNGDRREA